MRILRCLTRSIDTANSEDPTEISFAKGEILDIVDKQGKWWQSRRADGSTGSECLYPFSRTTRFSYTFRSRTIQLSTDHLKKTRLPCFCVFGCFFHRDLSYSSFHDNNKRPLLLHVYCFTISYSLYSKLCFLFLSFRIFFIIYLGNKPETTFVIIKILLWHLYL